MLSDITRIGNKLTEQFIKNRITRLQSSGYVKTEQEEIRATPKLLIRRSENQKRIDSSQKIRSYIEHASPHLGLSKYTKIEAFKIIDEVSNHHLLGGRDYQVIAAAIINIVSLNKGRRFTKARLAKAFHTNNDAVNQITEILLRIMKK